MKRIKAIVIDDNVSAIDSILTLSKKLDYLEISSTFTDAVKAGNYLKSKADIDLIFLDIKMPDMNGLEFLSTYKPTQQIIFISKHKEHAIDTYEIKNKLGFKIIDFIEFPPLQSRFIMACNNALESLKSKTNFIVLKDGKVNYKIKHDNIIVIEADPDDGHLMIFHLSHKIPETNKSELNIRKSLSDLEAELPTSKFIRVSKNAIVNIDTVILIDGEEIQTQLPGRKITIGDKWKEKFKIHFNAKEG